MHCPSSHIAEPGFVFSAWRTCTGSQSSVSTTSLASSAWAGTYLSSNNACQSPHLAPTDCSWQRFTPIDCNSAPTRTISLDVVISAAFVAQLCFFSARTVVESQTVGTWHLGLSRSLFCHPRSLFTLAENAKRSDLLTSSTASVLLLLLPPES